ncbi:MAG TPA: DUF5777 family beta-barrel protein [Vicinamibacterales bacterium]|jgi:hypothetical protein|nr:DUF5777 family beta-barrel protein [Vicinamibacterales bacterium]
MPRAHQSGVLLLVCLATLLSVLTARAQGVAPAGPHRDDAGERLVHEGSDGGSAGQAAAGAPDQAATVEDDDAAFRPLEPDYNLINLPTTLTLPLHKGDFHLTHRFSGNLRQGSFSDNAATLFGIDEGVVMSFEYRFGIARHVEIAASRTNFDRTIEISTKYDAFHQSASRPIGFSGIVSIEGTNNFDQQFAPALGASISRGIANKLELYAVPMWVHNSAAATGVMRNTFFVGLGGHVRVLPNVFLVAEASPRVAGYVIGDAEYGYGVEMRVGGHTFVLTFTNTQASTFAALARGGFPQSLYLGFNLSRKFF